MREEEGEKRMEAKKKIGKEKKFCRNPGMFRTPASSPD